MRWVVLVVVPLVPSRRLVYLETIECKHVKHTLANVIALTAHVEGLFGNGLFRDIDLLAPKWSGVAESAFHIYGGTEQLSVMFDSRMVAAHCITGSQLLQSTDRPRSTPTQKVAPHCSRGSLAEGWRRQHGHRQA